MASENLSGDIPAETRRWMENKVYRRRIHHNKTPAPEPEPLAIDLNSSSPPPLPVTSSPPLPPPSDDVVKNDAAKNESANADADLKPNRVVKIKLRNRSKSELCALRRILAAELDQVRAVSQKIDKFLGSDTAAMECANSQHSIANLKSYHNEEVNLNTYEVEQNIKDDELMVVDKQMIPPIAENKTELYRNPFVERNHDRAFRSCKALLTKLMRHKFGWVFNEPVDVKGLGLHDYYQFIREPMDLGTVKLRLAMNYYLTPLEFAGDVRLTFRNAMTYNPRGHEVHLMAEQLLHIFESRWPSIEAEYMHAPIAMEAKREPKREPKPKPKPKPSYPSAAHIRRKKHRALEKPKAKDLHKRDMTMEEKQKLRNNLEKLPQEKLEGLVEIIRKRSTGLNQKDDELEVDIDCMDTDTLWDLDRYVTNYKKSLSKYRRKAELAALAKAEAMRRSELERVSEPVVVGQTVMDTAVAATRLAYEAPKVENRMENPSRSISSRSSSSGSSSSDSDSDSSSSNGSNVAHSSKT